MCSISPMSRGSGWPACPRRSMQTPPAILLYGLSGAGKTTQARALGAALPGAGIGPVSVLDGEDIRARLPQPYGHSLPDRAKVFRHIVEFAAQEQADGRIPIIATIAHQDWMRHHARAQLSPLFEVFLDCPADVCAARDIKGHYARAARGEYDCFIGVTHMFERPDTADLVIDTALTPAAEVSARVLAQVVNFLGRA